MKFYFYEKGGGGFSHAEEGEQNLMLRPLKLGGGGTNSFTLPFTSYFVFSIAVLPHSLQGWGGRERFRTRDFPIL